MNIVSTIAGVREAVRQARIDGKSIGFVPTMGALHAGHGALIEAAVKECDFTVVSIFVNPLQFGPSEDLAQYPRDLQADAAFCRRYGVDVIFAPSDEEMYPDGQQLTMVEVKGLTERLCGASRPGHFAGVATVVAKLFQIVAPDKAYFGEKDFQQLAVIRKMVEELHFPLDVVPVETVREADGLAMSSRNQYLSPKERQAATVIFQGLQKARTLLEGGERNGDVIKQAVRHVLEQEPLVRVDYVEVVDAHDLQPLSYNGGERATGKNLRRSLLVAVAVFIGKTRLIDNIVF